MVCVSVPDAASGRGPGQDGAGLRAGVGGGALQADGSGTQGPADKGRATAVCVLGPGSFFFFLFACLNLKSGSPDAGCCP